MLITLKIWSLRITDHPETGLKFSCRFRVGFCLVMLVGTRGHQDRRCPLVIETELACSWAGTAGETVSWCARTPVCVVTQHCWSKDDWREGHERHNVTSLLWTHCVQCSEGIAWFHSQPPTHDISPSSYWALRSLCFLMSWKTLDQVTHVLHHWGPLASGMPFPSPAPA